METDENQAWGHKSLVITQPLTHRLENCLFRLGTNIRDTTNRYLALPIWDKLKLYMQYHNQFTYSFGSFLKTASMSHKILSAAGNGSSCIILLDVLLNFT